MSAPRPAKIRARQIADADLDEAAELLLHGFAPRRTRQFWRDALALLRARATPEGVPRYGYVLEVDGAIAGVILTIFSRPGEGGSPALRCNASSWYVNPAYRSYAPLLVAQALKHKDATYLNISSMPHTRPIIEAQGFVRYSNGLYIGFPLAHAGRRGGARVVPLRGGADDAARPDHDLLRDHATAGCMSFWCVRGGDAAPFVFRLRMVKGVVPAAQLVYCRAVEDVVRHAGAIGAHLASRGRLAVIIDANGRIPGLAGIYVDDVMPKYARGPNPPRLGDLAYTETALFGV